MKILMLLLLFTLSGCGPEGRFIKNPSGEMVYQLPESRDADDHCQSVRGFAIETAEGRYYTIQKNDEKKVTMKGTLADAQEDLRVKLRRVDRFTDVGKRNYDKMFVVLEEVYNKELDARSPREIGDLIYAECTEKMAKKEWFK